MNMRTFYGVLSLQRYFIKLDGYITKIICQRGNTIRMQIGKFRFLIALEIDPRDSKLWYNADVSFSEIYVRVSTSCIAY